MGCPALVHGGELAAGLRRRGVRLRPAKCVAGDHVTQGWTHTLIGRYCAFTGAHDDGRDHQRQALDHFQRAGDLPGQAWARIFACLACVWTGDWAKAATHSGQALALFRQAGDRYGQGLALASLGECHAHLENYELARGYARQALEVAPATGDPTSLVVAWDALGLVHSRLGEHRQAISCHRQALALAGQPKTPVARRMLASVLADAGDACRAAGDLPAARQAWQQALQILDDLRLADNLGLGARLEQAGPAGPPA